MGFSAESSLLVLMGRAKIPEDAFEAEGFSGMTNVTTVQNEVKVTARLSGGGYLFLHVFLYLHRSLFLIEPAEPPDYPGNMSVNGESGD